MARFYPNAQSASAPASEKRVFGALKSLGDDWIIIHGLRFIALGRGRLPPRNGEADFMLVHPRHGLLVLEVKGGRYEIEHGAWYTFPGGQRTQMDRSPFERATQNRYDLAEHINRQTGLRGLPFGHAVVFTDGAPRGDLGPAAPRAIVVDGTGHGVDRSPPAARTAGSFGTPHRGHEPEHPVVPWRESGIHKGYPDSRPS